MTLAQIFGPPEQWPESDVVTVSDRFDAALTLDAYRSGVFPMPAPGSGHRMTWWSPLSRGVLWPEQLKVSRSLRQASKHYTVSVNQAFDQVLAGCADRRRPYGWINGDIAQVYRQLHAQGQAVSVEVWTPDRHLAGGLYGVSLGGLFAGESMFHHQQWGRDASKVALLHLVERLVAAGGRRLIDVQWLTPHLASLGAIELDRADYLALAGELIKQPTPDWPEPPPQPLPQAAKRSYLPTAGNWLP